MARVSAAPKYGGYTYHFICKVPSELTCALCTEVLRDAQLTSCCGQHYCCSCLKEWRTRTVKPTCPHCRKVDFNHFGDLSVDRKVKQLRIRCKCWRKGCAWKGELGDLKEHLRKCEYNSTRCPRGCGESVHPRELSVHFMERCVLREIQCEHCGAKATYHDITTKHYDLCGDFPLKCPNACSSRIFKRSLLNKHLEHDCPLQQIDCQFQVAGCKARILRVDQKQHSATHVQSHTDLLLGAFQNSTQALIHEAGLLSVDAGTANKELPLECLRTIAGVYESQLKEGGPPLTFRMNNYSSFKQKDSTYWHSLTFSIGSYKMFVAVAANGIEGGRGSHVSVLLQTHHHDQHLCWYKEQLTIEILPQSNDALVDTSLCVVKGSEIPWSTFEEGGFPVTLFACPKFVAHIDVESGLLMQDSLVFRLSIFEPLHVKREY